MSDKTLIIVAVAAVALIVMSKKTQAAVGSTPPPSRNVNDQLWTNLMGGAWSALRDAQYSDGSPAFLKRNAFGQVTTSDGKPVGQELADLFPVTYGETSLPVDTTVDGYDYTSGSAGFGNVMGMY